jgi:hypothetical protein
MADNPTSTPTGICQRRGEALQHSQELPNCIRYWKEEIQKLKENNENIK